MGGAGVTEEEERMARRKRARSSDSSTSGMAGSVLGGSSRGARRKTTGMDMSRSKESTNGEVYGVVAGDVISGQRMPRLRPLGSRFAECEQAAANAAADLVVWWWWWRAGIRFFSEGKRERGFESD